MVEGGERLLGREEPFAGDELAAAFAAEGIDGHHRRRHDRRATRAAPTARSSPPSPTAARSRPTRSSSPSGAGRRRRRSGSRPSGSSRAGFVDVDDQLRAVGVAGGWLYAVGDCNGRALLTHMGKYQARIAGDVIAGRAARDVADQDVVPRVTFTDPQVCAVGLTEAQASERGVDVRTVEYGTGDVAGAYTLGNGVKGTSKLVVDEGRGVIVGATFTGPGVQELLHSATIADRRRGAARAALARRAVVPDRQRGLAAPPRGLRALTPDRPLPRPGRDRAIPCRRPTGPSPLRP